jgi:hypothetical protein
MATTWRADQQLHHRQCQSLSATFGIQSTRSDNPDVFGFTDTVNSLELMLPSRGSTVSRNASRKYSISVRQNCHPDSAFLERGWMSQELPESLQRSGSAELGPARIELFRRYGSPVHRLIMPSIANLAHTMRISRVPTLLAVMLWAMARFQETAIQSALTEGSSRHLHFTGAETGNDFADFLWESDCSSIAFGNADKYFRPNFYSAYLTDDYRVKGVTDINYRSSI